MTATKTPICPYSYCQQPYKRYITLPDNPNGNAGRPYFKCGGPCGRDFVCWDDTRGMAENNPACDCGIPSRLDRMGESSGRAGQGFWTCAHGTCRYYSEDINGKKLTVALGAVNEIVPFFVEASGTY